MNAKHILPNLTIFCCLICLISAGGGNNKRRELQQQASAGTEVNDALGVNTSGKGKAPTGTATKAVEDLMKLGVPSHIGQGSAEEAMEEATQSETKKKPGKKADSRLLKGQHSPKKSLPKEEQKKQKELGMKVAELNQQIVAHTEEGISAKDLVKEKRQMKKASLSNKLGQPEQLEENPSQSDTDAQPIAEQKKKRSNNVTKFTRPQGAGFSKKGAKNDYDFDG